MKHNTSFVNTKESPLGWGHVSESFPGKQMVQVPFNMGVVSYGDWLILHDEDVKPVPGDMVVEFNDNHEISAVSRVYSVTGSRILALNQCGSLRMVSNRDTCRIMAGYIHEMQGKRELR